MGRLGASLLAVYLGISPAFWWPGVPTRAFALAKFLLIASAVGLLVFEAVQRSALRFPAGLPGPLGFGLLILASIPGMLQADEIASLSFLKDIFLAFITMWAAYFYARSGKNVWNVLHIAGIIVAIHCALVVSSAVLGVPGWRAPPELRVLSGELTVGGFTSARTVWSQGVALFVPILTVSVLRSSSSSLLKMIIVSCFVVAIIGSQLVVGGRAGLLASAVQVIVICVLMRKAFFGVVFVGTVVLLAYLNPDTLEDHLRFGRLSQSGDQTIEELNSFSAGRIHGVIVSWNLVMESPVFGHGFGKRWIHNVWLRLWVEAGIMLPFTLAALVLILLKHGFRVVKDAQKVLTREPTCNKEISSSLDIVVVSIAVLVGGVTISFFSPMTILGAFQSSAIWWVCAGTLCGLFDLARKKVPEKSVQKKVHSLGGRSRGLQNQRNPLVKSLLKSGTFPTSGRRE